MSETTEATADTAVADSAATTAAAASTASATEATTAAPQSDKPAETKPVEGAPEKYDFKAPDDGAFDDKVLGSFSEVAKSLNLPQAAAQSILDKVAPVMRAQQEAAFNEFYADIGGRPDTWAAAVKADKEIGGDKLAENLAIAAKARDIGGPEFVKLLNKTGLGDHPAVVKTFLKLGRMLSEDKFVAGGEAARGNRSQADRIYGDPKS